jgi:hypothetical protein
MISGLLMELEDHNCWTIAEAASDPDRARQAHLRWNAYAGTTPRARKIEQAT